MIKLFPFLFSFALVTSLCAQENPSIYSEDSTPNEIEVPLTTIEFEKEVHDFGDVPHGSENEVVFKFTNTGDIPLVISSAKGSCGCTVPFYPKVPIMPGESSEIQAVFKPKSSQSGMVTKVITVSANTEIRTFSIKANVVATEDYEEEESLIIQNEQQEKDKEQIEAVNPGCFVIYPNPTSDELQLDLKEYIGLSALVTIHNDAGQEVLKETISSISSSTSRFNVSGYSPGIYIISIQVNGKEPMSQCFVVSN